MVKFLGYIEVRLPLSRLGSEKSVDNDIISRFSDDVRGVRGTRKILVSSDQPREAVWQPCRDAIEVDYDRGGTLEPVMEIENLEIAKPRCIVRRER